MLFKQRFLAGIEAGTITTAFRRWRRPSVKSGGTLQTPAGLLAIESVTRITTAEITPESASQAGFASVGELIDSLAERDGDLYRIAFHRAGDDPRIALREDDSLDATELARLQTRLQRLDDRSSQGPWTRQVLRLIDQHPELRAAELAAESGFEKEWLKTNVRKLKNLGLTESLAVGYRLSPRGRSYLRQCEADS